MPIRFCLLPVLALSALSSAIVPSAAHASAPAGDYVDALSYLHTDAQYEGWFALTHGLERNFDEICGDTFCEGDYGNYRALRFTCSVDRATGGIGMCTWSFAASNEEVDPATGRIATTRAFWRCRTPLARGTTIDELLAALQGDRPLYAALPHTQATAMDGLIDCL